MCADSIVGEFGEQVDGATRHYVGTWFKYIFQGLECPLMAALHGPIDRLPEKHYYYDSRADWIEINDELPKLDGEDGIHPLD